jgi:hypothetical protein
MLQKDVFMEETNDHKSQHECNVRSKQIESYK